jgi:hypothetical protein
MIVVVCARLTWLFLEVSTHTHSHALRDTRRHCDGDKCMTDSVFPPPHRELGLDGNQLASLPDSVFGGLSVLT